MVQAIFFLDQGVGDLLTMPAVEDLRIAGMSFNPTDRVQQLPVIGSPQQ